RRRAHRQPRLEDRRGARGALRAAERRGHDAGDRDARSRPRVARAPPPRDRRRAHRARRPGGRLMPFFELLLTAVDTIRANKVRAFLTTLGVIIGVLSVILLVALGEGAKQYLSDTFAGLGSNIIQI